MEKIEKAVKETGINCVVIAGGVSANSELRKRLSAKIKLPVHVADDPLKSVVRGTGLALKNYQRFPFIMR